MDTDEIRWGQVYSQQLANLPERHDWQTAAREIRDALVQLAELVEQLRDRLVTVEEEQEFQSRRADASG